MGPPTAAVRRPGRRRRIAWVTPFPPARSGIADYSAELLLPLSELVDLEVILDPHQPPPTPDLARCFTTRTAREALACHRARPYDLFVFHIGNSVHHIYMLPLLWRVHGLVVLHDYAIGSLVAAAMHFGVLPKSAAEELDFEGEPELAAQARAGRLGIGAAAERVPFNGRILRAADGVLVHSEWSAQRVRQRVTVPVATLPLAVQPPELQSQQLERRRLGLPSEGFVICTLGLVGPSKRVASLLQAVARLPERVRTAAHVAVVGAMSGPHGEELRALAYRLGLERRVHFTGRVPLADLAAYARAADVCVQLRYPTHGENSAVLGRALFAGAACLVSDHGPLGELPPGVAQLIRTPEHEVEDLVAHLCQLHDNPAARRTLGEAAARHAAQHFHPRRIATGYAALIEQTALRREARDALWVEQACDALERGPAAAATATLIERWAALRAGTR